MLATTVSNKKERRAEQSRAEQVEQASERKE
jgi:hypothetical protein